MRLNRKVITDHSLLPIASDDHHPAAVSFRWAINSQPIAAGTAWELRETIGDGHKIIEAVVRGKNSVDVQGHDGVFAIGTDSSGECSAVGNRPYGGSGYTTSYVGGYSRLHSDSYLSGWDMFGSNILLRDFWIDGDEAVLEFYNVGGTTQNLTTYGSAVAK